MNCPNCQAVLELIPPQIGDQGRRIVIFVICRCTANHRLGMREGWDRWYHLDWWMPGQLLSLIHPGIDAKSFYTRLTLEDHNKKATVLS